MYPTEDSIRIKHTRECNIEQWEGARTGTNEGDKKGNDVKDTQQHEEEANHEAERNATEGYSG